MSAAPNPQHNIIRRSFGLKEIVGQSLIADYHSELVEKAQSQGGILTAGRLTFRLAGEFGFCYGVDLALGLVYETRSKFPDRRILLLSEILHNPSVNKRLGQMGIEILPANDAIQSSHVRHDDIVVIPAFGATLNQEEELRNKGCLVVDTTCPSVIAVRKRVERYAQEGFTSIIHGKHWHEESRATSSQALKYEGGKYLIIVNKSEAAYVCRYIIEGGNDREFMEKFEQACSAGFDPDLDLCRVGLANQTTMLKDDSIEIAEMFREAISSKYGSEAVVNHFRHFDTICTATQGRQDAVKNLIAQGIDLMVIVGGYNSSNTTHLYEIASLCKPTYHIDGADCIISSGRIRHKPHGGVPETFTDNWLPEGEVVVGVTAGASTPNRIMGEVIYRIVGYTFKDSEYANI